MREVLLVDDERLVARLYARAVEAAGYQAVIVGDGETAFQRILAAPPALVLTDLHMPGLSGLELARRLLERGLKSCPLILMSADDTAALVNDGVAAGIDDFLVKGVKFDRLTARLRQWLEGPYSGLPAHVRAAALDSLAREAAPARPIAHLHGSIDSIVERGVRVITDMLRHAPAGFGGHIVEQLRLLGVIDGVLALLSRSNGLAQLRRPEALQAVVGRLPGHAAALLPMLPAIDRIAADATFRHAAESLVLTLR